MIDRSGGKDVEDSGMPVHRVNVDRRGYRLTVQLRSRARERSENRAAAAAAERRLARSRYEAAKSGGEALQRSTRSPSGGAGRPSVGMHPDSLSSPEDGLGKRLRPCFLKRFYEDHEKRHKMRPIYCLITTPKGTLPGLIYLHRYDRDTVTRFPGAYLIKHGLLKYEDKWENVFHG